MRACRATPPPAGLSRLDWTLTPDVDAMIVTLGGNDMLRGIDPANQPRQSDGDHGRGQNAECRRFCWSGMQAPGNYGPEYKTQFDAIYPDLAARIWCPFGRQFL